MSQCTHKYGLCEEPVSPTLNHRYVCPVCGFLLKHPADDFNICPSCGVEFGYETEGRTFAELQEEWLRSGARWSSKVHKPPMGWKPIQQLENLGTLSPAREAMPIRILLRREPNVKLGQMMVTFT